MLHQVFDHVVYEYQDWDFVKHCRSWFDGSADLNWTNELRGLRNAGNLDQINQLCQSVADCDFLNFITSHANNFLQHNNIQEKSLVIGIWPFAMTADLFHAPHHHVDSQLSGTYYVEIPPGSGAIHFHSDSDIINSKTHVIDPRAGMLLIWSSTLRHSVPQCEFVGTRKAISFDIALAKR